MIPRVPTNCGVFRNPLGRNAIGIVPFVLLLAVSSPAWATELGVPDLFATVSNPAGDTAPAFAVHSFPAPSDGFFTDVTIRQDSDTIDEAIDFLVLRGPLSNLEVIHRLSLDPDETGAGWFDNGDGTQTHSLGMLAVQAGDIFGHWHGSPTGPVPVDAPNGAQGGDSRLLANVPSGDLDVGDFYTGGFLPNEFRDYLISVRHVPEPSTLVLIAFAPLGWFLGRRSVPLTLSRR